MKQGEQNIRIFLQISQAHARTEGMPVEVMIAQGLLMGIAISGNRLVWKMPEKTNPQVGRASVTWLGLTGEIPLWFHRYTEPLTKWDENVQGAMLNTMVNRAKVQPRKIRRHERALGNWIPHAFEGYDVDLKGYQNNPSSLVVRPGWKPTKQHLAAGIFGSDRLLLLAGKGDYGKLLNQSESGAQLRSAAINQRGGLRVTINGWCESKVFTKLRREFTDPEADMFGWILPALRPYAIPNEVWMKAKFIGCVYTESIKLRFSVPIEPYIPSPEVAELLSEADNGWKAPSWCESKVITPLLQPEKLLAWQLAAQLANIHGELKPGTHEEHLLAQLAIELSGWIRGMHAREMRLIYPGPEGDPLEPISCRIADQLRISSPSVREFVRGFHKISTEEVTSCLDRMQEEGWVEPVGERRFGLAFSDLPGVSAKLSEIVAEES